MEEVLSLKNTTPEIVWEATYQGNPKAPQGSTFKRAWWAEGLNRYDWASHRLELAAVGRWISFDTAQKDAESNAYSTGIVFDLLPDYRAAVRDIWRDRVQIPELAPTVEALARKWNRDDKLRGIIIEDKASGIGLIQTIRSVINYEWISDMLTAFQPMTDKLSRAVQASVWCRNGMILLPHPGPDWLYDFEDELFGFPNSTHMDQVDAFSQLILFLENLLREGYQLRAGNHPLALAEAMGEFEYEAVNGR